MSEKNGENAVMIPYYVHEGEMNRLERANKRLIIGLIIVFLAFVGTNLGCNHILKNEKLVKGKFIQVLRKGKNRHQAERQNKAQNLFH